MMSSSEKFRKKLINIIIVAGFGIIPALVCQFFAKQPVRRDIHITSFRYGKEPSVIRCNRGDTLHLTFSSRDTGHSFFLEEFDVDAKINPSSDEITVFKTSDPTAKPFLGHELVLIAKHSGIMNYLAARSNYRCHVWCGPMHAFEQGKLVILPNTLLFFSTGILAGILFLFIRRLFSKDEQPGLKLTDILSNSSLLKKLVSSRWPQVILTLFAMLMIYIVILTATLGTKVSGRNLGVLLMWAIWLFFLVAVLTPFFGRFWCTICPLPSIGDWLQRRSFFSPREGTTGEYKARYYGLFRKWPNVLANDWPKLFFFMLLATFSTTLVATPVVSGIAVLMLLLVPTIMSGIWEHRSFCRYVCPVSVFVGPYSRMSLITVRNKSQSVCDRCKPKFCKYGSSEAWACPYGINVGEMKDNSECGLCLECLRSCKYNNVSLFRRPFASELGSRNPGQAWLNIAIFTLAIVYSVLYQGHWPAVRDYVNILDKGNWDLFGIYTIIVWSSALVIMPAIFYLLSFAGVKSSGAEVSTKQAFLLNTRAILPLGLTLWIAFVIPMLFVNVTFVIQSLSDPFGWGWDFFGTANTPWHQFLPGFIPIIQAAIILTGFYYTLRNLDRSYRSFNIEKVKLLMTIFPMVIFVTVVATGMIFFFTN